MATWSQSALTVEPVTLAEVKTHLRISGTADDVYLHQLAVGARQQVEQFTGRALIQRTVTLDLSAPESVSPIPLMYPPVASITSVTGYDNDGNTTVVSASNYFLKGSRELIQAPNTSGWSEEAERWQWALRIVYTAGYGTAPNDVPYDLRHALMVLVADLYETRQSEVIGKTVNVSRLNWRSLARSYCINRMTEVY